MSDAYSKGMEEIAEKTSEKQYDSKADPKNYRNIAIDAFEDAFTGLFGSDVIWSHIWEAVKRSTGFVKTFAEYC